MENTITNKNKAWFEKGDNIEEYIQGEAGILRLKAVLELLDDTLAFKGQVNEENLKLLSVGCSTGMIEREFINRGIRVYGMDATDEALEKAQMNGLIVVKSDAETSFPFENGEFDFVFAGEIIEHLLDTKKLLLEINRVLKKRGILIVTTPNLARFSDRIRFLFGKAPKHTTPIHEFLYLHIRPFTFSSLKSSLETCGFKVTGLKSTFVQLLPFIKTKVRSKSLAKFFPTLGNALIVRAVKL